MFTGLIEAVGEIAEVKPTPGGLRLRLATGMAPELVNGDSLAVNGVCLTVVSADAQGVHADVSPETARVTTRGGLKRGGLTGGGLGPPAARDRGAVGRGSTDRFT